MDERAVPQVWSNEPRPLPDWIEEAYQVLLARTAYPRDGLSHERAHELLLTHGDFPDESADAEYAIERLLKPVGSPRSTATSGSLTQKPEWVVQHVSIERSLFSVPRKRITI